jgi:hypothetical protein
VGIAKPEYSIIRYKKCNQQTVIKAWKHNTRRIKVQNADGSERVEHIAIYNNYKDELSLSDIAKDRIVQACIGTIRSDAIYAVELLLTATPSFFAEDKELPFDINTNCDSAKLIAWRDRSVDWLKSEYGDLLIQGQLHLDESTPHIHAFFVPLINLKTKVKVGYKKYKTQMLQRLSAKAFITRPWSYNLHDSYSEAMLSFGLVRGERGKQQTHQKLKQRSESEHDILKRQEKLQQLGIRINESEAEAKVASEKTKDLQLKNEKYLYESERDILKRQEKLQQLGIKINESEAEAKVASEKTKDLQLKNEKYLCELERDILEKQDKLQQLGIRINESEAEAKVASEKTKDLQLKNEKYRCELQRYKSSLNEVKNQLSIASEQLKNSKTENSNQLQINRKLTDNYNKLTNGISEAELATLAAGHASKQASEDNAVQQKLLNEVVKEVNEIIKFHQSADALVKQFSRVSDKYVAHIKGLNITNSVKDEFDSILHNMREISQSYLSSKNSRLADKKSARGDDTPRQQNIANKQNPKSTNPIGIRRNI